VFDVFVDSDSGSDDAVARLTAARVATALHSGIIVDIPSPTGGDQ